MQPADRGHDPRRHRAALDGRARYRSVAGSQSDQRRGDAVSRLSRGRCQPGVARRAGARRRRAQGTRPAAQRARSARRGRGGAGKLRALLVRPDLCAAAADAGSVGRRASARARRGRRAYLALPAHYRAGHAVLRAACRPASSRRPTTTLRARSTMSRRRSAPRPAGRRTRFPITRSPAPSAGTTWSTGGRTNMPASVRARMAGSTSTASAMRSRPSGGPRAG